jgi:anti-sigma factor RsiW
MSTWHVGEGALAMYLDRSLDAVQRASVEAHLMRCAACRATVAGVIGGAAGSVSFDRLWDRIETRVEDLPAERTAGWLRRLGAREPDAVVVRATASQSAQWTVATTLVLAVATLAAALGRNDSARLAFLVLAPLVPPWGWRRRSV